MLAPLRTSNPEIKVSCGPNEPRLRRPRTGHFPMPHMRTLPNLDLASNAAALPARPPSQAGPWGPGHAGHLVRPLRCHSLMHTRRLAPVPVTSTSEWPGLLSPTSSDPNRSAKCQATTKASATSFRSADCRSHSAILRTSSAVARARNRPGPGASAYRAATRAPSSPAPWLSATFRTPTTNVLVSAKAPTSARTKRRTDRIPRR